MGRVSKFLVLLGGVAAIVGAFLPLSKAVEQIAAAAQKAGWGAIFAGGKGSLFDLASTAGSHKFIVFGTLALLGLTVLFALIGTFRRFGRGLALGALLAAIPPSFIMGVGISQSSSFGGAGIGLLLLLGGSGLAVLGAVLGVVSPERASA